MRALGGLLLGGFVLASGVPYFLNETAEAFGDDAHLSGRTLLLLALIGLGAMSLAGLGAVLLIFA